MPNDQSTIVLLQRLTLLDIRGDTAPADEEQLAARYEAAYRAYRERWLAIPGDHGPGRLLPFPQWRELLGEWAEAQRTALRTNDPISTRGQQLQRALLLVP